ncbi:RNA 2',3'-cyclic phosphodiesterase [Jeotgalibacillus terrae]|uniref:RNA 2',3'-cyclic phosphodiesterase n=1 Tax=Jeotgalibacillus terrae TaxID=587735 RepID=A0ABW5ZJY7_9BACL|nr:RNA 2',3'-cyclic phosphodiesterase [Jeotgalibacillus terrae]MBM7578996.1 2'-5' RNA ligase [Jeotgalibacillus terrae]
MGTHYFIACKLPYKVKNKLYELQQAHMQQDCFKKYPERDDLHITLSFFGAVSEQELKIVCAELDNKIKSHKAFRVTFDRIDTFGQESAPRVWWAGPKPSAHLTDLYRTVQDIAGLINKNEHRPFRPHVTLAKKWKGEPVDVYRGPVEPVTGFIDEVVIYEIHPEKRPMYDIYASYQLSESGENDGTVN